MRLQIPLLTLFGMLLACIVAAAASEPAPLALVADVPLSGSAVRFDYQSLDVTNNRLYLAHTNADQLVVFDTKKRSVIATRRVSRGRQPQTRRVRSFNATGFWKPTALAVIPTYWPSILDSRG
jgi:hypothetical protein